MLVLLALHVAAECGLADRLDLAQRGSLEVDVEADRLRLRCAAPVEARRLIAAINMHGPCRRDLVGRFGMSGSSIIPTPIGARCRR